MKYLKTILFLILSLLLLLVGCSHEPRFSYKIDSFPLYENEVYYEVPYFIDSVYVEDNKFYGNLVDELEHPILFGTTKLIGFNFDSENIEEYDFSPGQRVMNFIIINSGLYYISYEAKTGGIIWSLKKYVDGNKDELILTDDMEDLFNSPKLLKYDDNSFILARAQNNKTLFYKYTESELELRTSFPEEVDLAISKVRDGILYFCNLDTIYSYDLSSSIISEVVNTPLGIERFAITDNYLLVSGERELGSGQENIIYSLKKGKEIGNTEDGGIRWIEGLNKDFVVLTTSSHNDIVYIDLKTQREFKITGEEEDILRHLPVKFLAIDNSIVAVEMNKSIIYKITFDLK